MNDRDVVVRDSGNSVATFGIIAIVVVAALIALFVWQPWNQNSTTNVNSKTTVTEPGTSGAGAGAGTSNAGTSNSGTSSTTTTTTGK